jgi:hypothetical protein
MHTGTYLKRGLACVRCSRRRLWASWWTRYLKRVHKASCAGSPFLAAFLHRYRLAGTSVDYMSTTQHRWSQARLDLALEIANPLCVKWQLWRVSGRVGSAGSCRLS